MLQHPPLPTAEPPPGFDGQYLTPPPLAEREWRVAALALDLSGRCNLACRYCAEAATQPRREPMTPATLEAAWAYLFPDGKPSGAVSIRLGSGEPLLAFPLMLKLAELIQKASEHNAGNRPLVFLTTNGTLVDRDMARWLASSGWRVKISLDGPRQIHDAWRVRPDGRGTFLDASSAVALLADLMPKRLGVTAVLCRGADPEEVFEAIARMGVRRIELVPVAHHDEAIQPGPADILRYEEFLRRHVDRYLDGPDAGRIPVLVRFSELVARVMGYGNSRVACGAGRSFLAVDSNGDLYPCFRFVGLTQYRLGDLDGGLDEQAARSFRQGPGRAYEQRRPCRECWAVPLYKSPCFACAEMFGPGDGRPPSLHCAYALADARAAVRLVDNLRSRDPERLLAFLPITGSPIVES